MPEGIKECLEIFALGDAVASSYVESMKDNDVDWMDLPKWAPTVSAAKRAAEGSDKIPAELKDLDAEEIEKLFVAASKTVSNMILAMTTKHK